MLEFFHNIWNWTVAWFRHDDVQPEPPPTETPKPEPPPKRKRASGYKVLEPLRRDIESTTISIIERLGRMNVKNSEAEHGRINDYEKAMSYLAGCDFHLITDMAQKMDGGSKFMNPEGQSRDYAEAMWPIDIATVMETSNGLAFNRIWTADPVTMRGKAKLVPPKCVWNAYLSLHDDDSWWADLSPIGLVGNRWIYLDQGMRRVVTDNMNGIIFQERNSSNTPFDEAERHTGMAFSIALSERYSWHVAFGSDTEKSLRLLLPTNPLGCLALFKTREKKADETRRAALRHWVSSFYREHGDRDIAFVRDHLRGTTLFDWRGLNCEILVSQFDLEKNEFFKNQADEWRAQRKHNRVKIKLKRKA